MAGFWDPEPVPHHLVPELLHLYCQGGDGGDRARMKSPPFLLSNCRRAGGLRQAEAAAAGGTWDGLREGTVCLLTRCDSKWPVASGARQAPGRHHSCSLCLRNWLRGEGTRRGRGEKTRGPASCLSQLPSPRSLGAGGGGEPMGECGWLSRKLEGNGIVFAKRRRHLLKMFCKAVMTMFR